MEDFLRLRDTPVERRAESEGHRLPDDCSLEDVLYHPYVIQKVEAGLAARLASGGLQRSPRS
jgi:hypothetical protein